MDNGESENAAKRSALRRSAPLLAAAVAVFGIVAVLASSKKPPTAARPAGTSARIASVSQTALDSGESAETSRAPATYEEHLFMGRAEVTDPRLALSEDQRERLADLHHDGGNAAQLTAESRRIENELGELLSSENASEQDIIDKANRLNEALSDLRSARIRAVLEIRKILSPAQRRTALQIIQERDALASRKSAPTEAHATALAAPADDESVVDEYDEPQVDESLTENSEETLGK